MNQQTLIGKGTLKEFQTQYDILNQHKNITVKASTLFPTGKNLPVKETLDPSQEYEFVIYYDEYIKEGTPTKTVQAPCGPVKVPKKQEENQELVME